MAKVTISGHELIKEIGSGASGRVWLAQSLTGTYRAVKIVRRDKFDDAKPYEREFAGITEYESISRKHDCLIDLLHVGRGEDDSFFYYVMELADDWITGMPFGDESDWALYQPRTLQSDLTTNHAHSDAINIILKIARGLKGIHDKGLVHRDIKPGNIVYVDNEPKLADPGLIAQAGSLTAVGTYGYVAPEISDSLQPASRQSDIYSLGKLFYQLLTGLPPEKFPVLSRAIGKNQIREVNPIWAKACDPNPEDRYSTIDDFIQALESLAFDPSLTPELPKKTTVKLILRDIEGAIVVDRALDEGEYSIGRSESSNVRIPDACVSRKHATLRVTSQGVVIEDEKSTGGTYIDDFKISGPVSINEIQTIRVGDHTISISQSMRKPGQVLGEGRYSLQKHLGTGRSADVWQAFDKDSQEEIAMKIFPDERLNQPEFLDGLRLELRKTRKLNHENILNVYDIHISEDEPLFLTMELISGVCLEDLRNKKGVMTWPEISPLLDQLCRAVDYAHSKKIVHCDIKPANILIDRNHVLKLADFGVARTIVTSTFTAERTEGWLKNQIAGTLEFMSPEVLKGERPSPSDDIYAIGVMLYELLTGRLPFDNRNQKILIDQIWSQPAIPIDRVIAEQGIENIIPEHICAVVMACLSKNQDHRPKKAQSITANYS
jgi:serine/threonine protein kinase